MLIRMCLYLVQLNLLISYIHTDPGPSRPSSKYRCARDQRDQASQGQESEILWRAPHHRRDPVAKLKEGAEGLLSPGKGGTLGAGDLDLCDLLHHELEEQMADAREGEKGKEDEGEQQIWRGVGGRVSGIIAGFWRGEVGI